MKKLIMVLIVAVAAGSMAMAQDAPDQDQRRAWFEDARASHPDLTNDQLRQLHGFHRQHPEIEKADIRDMWQFRQQNPELDKQQLSAAYKEYRADRNVFRSANGMQGRPDMSEAARRKTTKLSENHPDASKKDVATRVRKMDDKEKKQAHTKRNMKHAAGKKSGKSGKEKSGGGGGF